jgi:group I intron endonuclease
MKEKVGIVYRWINIENQKWYIGSHFGTLDDGYISSGKIFLAAYKKNQNKMMRQILFIGPEFRKAEEFYLLFLDAARDKQSYNMKNTVFGGGVPLENLSIKTRQKISEALKRRVRKPLTPEQRQKISKTLTGRKLSEELKQKYSKIQKGDKNSFYGKKHTKESKEKMRQASLGKRYNSMEFMKSLHKKAQKMVYSNLDNILFKSITDCANYYNLSACSISNMIANRTTNRYQLTKEIPEPCGVHVFAGCEQMYLEKYCAKFPDYCKQDETTDNI